VSGEAARDISHRRLLMLGIGLAVSALFLVLLFREVDLTAVLRGARKASPGLLALSLLTKFGGLLCLTGRSRVLLRPVAPYRVMTILRSVMLAFLGNNVLPFRLGEVLRIDYLARHGQVSRGATLAVVAFERVVDSFWLLVILAAVSPLIFAGLAGAASLGVFAGAVAVAMVGGWAVSRYPGAFLAVGRTVVGWLGERALAVLEPRMEAFVGGFGALGSARRTAAVLLFTLGYWLMQAGSVTLWILAFGLVVPWYAAFVVLVFIAFGAALPSSPGFVGTYDYFAMRGLALFSVDQTVAAAFAIVGHTIAIVPFSLVALVILFPELKRIRFR
jgi:uncharacterized protein (TIRG00374 family)